jgi:hypothetical protein
MHRTAPKKRISFFPAIIAIVVFCAFLPASLGKPQAPASPDFAAVEQAALDLGTKYGTERVLLVFDMDNTLLSMNQDFGSDEWFTWQRALAAADPAKIKALTEVQGILFDLSSMHPPEPGVQPRVVAALQDRGFAAIVLTGRSPLYRSATERELGRNGLDFSKTAVGPQGGFGGSFLPYDARNSEASGFILPCDRERMPLPAPQKVSYQNGVMMTSGQDKGLMLRSLLSRAGRHFAAVLFVDDSAGNLKAVTQAFSCTSVEVVPVLYTKGRRAAGIDTSRAAAQYRQLKSFLQGIFAKEVD